MNSIKIEHMLGQMIIIGVRGTTKEDAKTFFESHKNISAGGIIIYDENVTTTPWSAHNIINADQLKEFNESLQKYSNVPLFIGVDQEGGNVNRLKSKYGFPDFSSWEEIGKTNDARYTSEHAKLVSQTLSECGFNLNFAPVLDVKINSDSFIAKEGRCLSNDTSKIIEHAKVFINEHYRCNVVPVGKHFPGQGSAVGDSHDGLIDVTNSWHENELDPYKKLIRDGSLKAIMTSHLFNSALDTNYPATLSKKILDDLLRKDIGFNGIIISDDPSMGAISKFYNLKETLRLMVNAGVDMFCFGNNLHYESRMLEKVHNILIELYKEGEFTYERIFSSYNRIMNMKKDIGLF